MTGPRRRESRACRRACQEEPESGRGCSSGPGRPNWRLTIARYSSSPRCPMRRRSSAIAGRLDRKRDIPSGGGSTAQGRNRRSRSQNRGRDSPARTKPTARHGDAAQEGTRGGRCGAEGRCRRCRGLPAADSGLPGHAAPAARRALARWITHPDNPLTARMAINQIWMHHFDTPLVASVFDFGRNGKPPTIPALLDWLAVELQIAGLADETDPPADRHQRGLPHGIVRRRSGTTRISPATRPTSITGG